MLVFALSLGGMFASLYAASVLSEPGHAHFDKIPTQAKVSQLEAIEIIENDLRAKVPELQETRLMFQLYNFSAAEYSAEGINQYADYRHKLGYGWTFSHIRESPELLQLPLRFVHANGTVYDIDESARSFEKICDEPSVICPMGRFGTFAKDRLVYAAEVRWEPATEELMYFNEGFYIIDAESGKIVWNSIDYEKNRKPIPNVNYDNRTIRQLFEERLNPPEIAHVDIERGASLASNERGYLPKEIRVTLGIDSKVLWTNRDTVMHTVVSDSGYSNPYTGRFESELIELNKAFEYTFFETGEYPYHCDVHPWMIGRVHVVENFV
jgi:plastocyanin